MAYKYLKDRFASLPLVLAGPILRRVTYDSVTVWLALKEERSEVTVVVSDDAGNSLTGTGNTRQIGAHLHVAVITARSVKGQKLKPNTQCKYTTFINGALLSAKSVYGPTEGSDQEIYYKNTTSTTFMTPPENWRELRLLHGSCRLLHSAGNDLMHGVDVVTSNAVELGSGKRPHMLFLTGDQIYADDVSSTMLNIIRDAGQCLFGYDLKYNPGAHEKLDGSTLVDLPYGDKRAEVTLKLCHFTCDFEVYPGHLLFFYEYCTMYLMAWSDVLWPEPEGVTERIIRGQSDNYPDKSKLDELIETQKYQKLVRRALANVPTYMVMDDHEVTDDWNFSANWCARVLSSPTGRNVVRNALMAGAVFQAWGNTPEQFEPAQPGNTLPNPGDKLLTEIGKLACGKPTSDTVTTIEKCLGMPESGPKMFDPPLAFGEYPVPEKEKKDPTPSYASSFYSKTNVTPALKAYMTSKSWSDPGPRLARPEALTNIKWHYSLSLPTYQFIMLDGRTQRAFPGCVLVPGSEMHGEFPPTIVHETALKEQICIEVPPDCSPQVTFVISAAIPYGTPALEAILESRLDSASTDNIRDLYIFEAEEWNVQQRALETLISELATRCVRSDGTYESPRKRRVVLLSGDIHHSFALRLRYRAKSPFTDTDVSTDATFALLTASGFKQQNLKTLAMDFVGLRRVAGPLKIMRNMPDIVPKFLSNIPKYKHWFGWKNPSQQNKSFMTAQGYDNPETYSSSDHPVMLCPDREDKKPPYAFLSEPDWRYYVDFIRVDGDLPAPVDPKTNAGKVRLFGERLLALGLNTNADEMKTEGPQSLVGINNFGEVYFTPLRKLEDKEILTSDDYFVCQAQWVKRMITAEFNAWPKFKYRVDLTYDSGSDPKTS